jgi:hypothetical protein
MSNLTKIENIDGILKDANRKIEVKRKVYATIGNSPNVFSIECESCGACNEDPYGRYCAFCGGHVAPKYVGTLKRKLLGGTFKELEVNGRLEIVYI